MGSTFSGIELTRRGLGVHQQALETTGHNISNADNKHYARQRVNITTATPLYEPSLNRPSGIGMLGQGPKARDIERMRDHFVDKRINDVQQSSSYWETKETYLHQTEIIFNEPSDESLRSKLDIFWQSWQDLSQYPEEMSHREQVRTRGKELTFHVRKTFQDLFDLRQRADFDVKSTVEQINSLANQVRALNARIQKSEGLGDNPNDLLDRRDELLQELSTLANVSIDKRDPDEIMVYLGGEMLIQGDRMHTLVTKGDAKNEGLHKVVWAHSDKEVVFTSSKMQALLEVRDGVLKENIEKLDLLAVNLSDITNEVHRDGFGLTKETNIDFFKISALSQNIRGNFDLNGDGQNDVSALFKVAGKNELVPDKPVGIAGTLTFTKNDAENTPVYITYRADESLREIIQRINRSDSGVVAYLNHNNNLALKGTVAQDDWRSNFMIRHIEDSGELLVGYAGLLQNSGPGGSFDFKRLDEINKLQSNLDRITLSPTFHPAGAMFISDEVQGNVAYIAASAGKDIGGTGDVNQAHGDKDGANALRIGQALRHKETMVGNHKNTDEFYNALIAKLGVETRTSKDQIENNQIIMKNLENLRQSKMGVNLDEEMASMVQFQHGYNASARMMQVFNEMLDKIINRLF